MSGRGQESGNYLQTHLSVIFRYYYQDIVYLFSIYFQCNEEDLIVTEHIQSNNYTL